MKTIMITAPSSGSGKTTVTMGLIRALKKKGLDVCGYKIGPDYIDRAFLEAASGKPAGNLDLHLQGEKGVFYALAQANSEYGVFEGVMGYFDGISNTYQNSSYHFSRLLNIPSLLIYMPRGEMFSVVPKIKGMAEFEASMIQAIIFNNVSERYYKLLKEAVENYTSLNVLGFIPKMKDVELKSRHLGLVQSIEIPDLERKIDTIAKALTEHIDFPALLSLMKEPTLASVVKKEFFTLKERELTVAIAKDQAFSFYYRENLHLLEELCQVIYFSPLQDSRLPACDLVYLGGGYPEVFYKELSQNTAMLRSVKAYAENGGYLYAECGGFMYLTEYIEDAKMVGVFKGKSSLTSTLQRFGYIDIELKNNCLLGNTGDRLTAHEFHKSVSEVEGETLYRIKKTMGENVWECGYTYNNVIAGYPHISFIGNMKMLHNLLAHAKRNKKRCM